MSDEKLISFLRKFTVRQPRAPSRSMEMLKQEGIDEPKAVPVPCVPLGASNRAGLPSAHSLILKQRKTVSSDRWL
jgi:hypothetical protein